MHIIKEIELSDIGMIFDTNQDELLQDDELLSYFDSPDNFKSFVEDLDYFFDEKVTTVAELKDYLNQRGYGEKTITRTIDILSTDEVKEAK